MLKITSKPQLNMHLPITLCNKTIKYFYNLCFFFCRIVVTTQCLKYRALFLYTYTYKLCTYVHTYICKYLSLIDQQFVLPLVHLLAHYSHSHDWSELKVSFFFLLSFFSCICVQIFNFKCACFTLHKAKWIPVPIKFICIVCILKNFFT